ncbi:septal ring lytic transglycosylase RlpA family protein [Maricaulis sp.]|uniref:septal ring lytic transglycosylase RlpA family protein n=1 Tax=Maricaulis sp. TaxID=1486257 RepID=UPI002B272528|nr:septal ring lytic transglycosylase RlpA family protein [Maricaulis sp.]
MLIWRLFTLVAAISLVAACSSSPSHLRSYSDGRSGGSGSGWSASAGGGTRASGSTDPSGLIAASSAHQKIGRAYTVAGRTYRPRRDDRYDETGIASWYGPNFHGRPTANGERFDQHAMTAAHTTLPIPSIVEVTNLENGRSVIVRLNDRGPFVEDRLIDLSRAAATELDYIGSGLARVRVRYLGPAHEDGAPPNRVYHANADPAPAQRPAPVQVAEAAPAHVAPVAAPPALHSQSAPEPLTRPAGSMSGNTVGSSLAVPVTGQYSLQLGAFSDPANAEAFVRRLDGAGDIWIEPGQSGGGPVWRVFFGRWTDRTAAQAARVSLSDHGIHDSRIVATR